MRAARGRNPLAMAASILLLAAAPAVAPLAPTRASAATIVIVNNDGPGEGFNDFAPATPIGGNPGTTVGAQRLYVFQYAAGIWGSMLQSGVQIRVDAQFDPQTCTATSGVLGAAGPVTVHRDFSGATFPGTWYHQALANRLSGFDVTGESDIVATFNSSVGGGSCLPMGWYYGVDGNEGGQIELLPVVLHELGHGLGFGTTTNGQTGAYLNGFPHIYDRFLLDTTLGLHWNQITPAERAASAMSCGSLVWDGAQVTSRAQTFLGPKSLLRVNGPPTAAGDYQVGKASFGLPLTQAGVTGDVVLANDGVGVVTDACEPLINVVAGRIVLMDRGGCALTTQVKSAQNGGAIGAIVADTQPTCPPAAMGGFDPTITIPSVRITQDDGVILKANLAGLNATLRTDSAQKAGAHANGRVMVYTPNPYQPGSSVSHWDASAEPNLLMEPAITGSLSSDVDLARQHFTDMGWDGAPKVELAMGQVGPNPGADLVSVQFSTTATGRVVLRVFDVRGRLVLTPLDATLDAGAHTATIRAADLPGGVYFYHLVAGSSSRSRRLVVLR